MVLNRTKHQKETSGMNGLIFRFLKCFYAELSLNFQLNLSLNLSAINF